MSEALLDRFDHNVEVTTDWELAAYLGVGEDIIRVSTELDRRRRAGEIGWSPQLRSLLSYQDAKKTFGEQYALSNMIAKAPLLYRQVVAEALEAVFKGKAIRMSNDIGEPCSLSLGRRFR